MYCLWFCNLRQYGLSEQHLWGFLSFNLFIRSVNRNVLKYIPGFVLCGQKQINPYIDCNPLHPGICEHIWNTRSIICTRVRESAGRLLQKTLGGTFVPALDVWISSCRQVLVYQGKPGCLQWHQHTQKSWALKESGFCVRSQWVLGKGRSSSSD